mmetsp:Transcript_2478/g.8904  ORF Transcript_2478/g.8904 Transcript_2478/m.8904 type:complete len:102 (+) Transcript_2478:1486-1791(+)
MSSTSWGRYVHAGTNASTTSEGMDVESSSLHMYAVAKHMHAAIRARTITASQHAFIKVKLFKDDTDDDDDDDESSSQRKTKSAPREWVVVKVVKIEKTEER